MMADNNSGLYAFVLDFLSDDYLPIEDDESVSIDEVKMSSFLFIASFLASVSRILFTLSGKGLSFFQPIVRREFGLTSVCA